MQVFDFIDKNLMKELISVSMGEKSPDTVIKNGTVLNVFTKKLEKADVAVHKNFIVGYGDDFKISDKTKVIDASGLTLVPGFIDGHIHYEVTKLSLAMFAKLVVPFGTTAIITGLDETYTVLGKKGIEETLKESKNVPLTVFYGVPSKLPYTIPSSTLRYELNYKEAAKLLPKNYSWGVWETVAEFITNRDKDILSSLELARRLHKPIFGCLPLASKQKINSALIAGVVLDHESYSPEEMYEKARNGMYVMIRESSVTHFLKKNINVIKKYGLSPDRVGICTDDVYAKDVIGAGHINRVVKMLIDEGIPHEDAYRMASYNVASMYRIDDLVGSISPGKLANIIFLNNYESVSIRGVMSKGFLVSWEGKYLYEFKPQERPKFMINTFSKAKAITEEKIYVKTRSKKAKVISIEVNDQNPFRRLGKIIDVDAVNGEILPDPSKDLLYGVVVERHKGTGNVATAFVSGFGLKEGAMASSSAPDDNNIVSVGTNKKDITVAVNTIIKNQGGMAIAKNGSIIKFLHLPIGGILGDIDPGDLAREEKEFDKTAQELGSNLSSAISTMTFLPVTAIPDYALTDKGLVDCINLKVISPVIESI
ncbi:MAG: adenine deaminase C-terminal domain-containing protein [Nitrososphaeria archaeon]|jgi:adenine deaminase